MNRIELIHLFLVLLVLLGITATAKFTVTTEAEIDHSRLLLELQRPTDIAAAPMLDPDGVMPLSVCVDDHAAGLFVVGSAPNGELAPQALIPFDGRAAQADDFEAVSYEPATASFYALTSHRARHGKGDDTLLVRFSLDASRWQMPDYHIASEIDVAFTRNLAAWQNETGFFRAADGTPLIFWNQLRNAGPSYPNAFELEGVAVHDGSLLVGVKYPLNWHAGHLADADADVNRPLPAEVKNRAEAILIDYDPAGGALRTHLLPLGGLGISALAWDERSRLLIVAASDLEHQNRMSATGLNASAGRSAIFLCRPTADGWKLERRAKGEFSVPGALLKGIAPVGDELWLTYAGGESSLRRVPRSAVFAD